MINAKRTEVAQQKKKIHPSKKVIESLQKVNPIL